MQRGIIGMWILLGSLLLGQTVDDARADFLHQEKALQAKFLKYMQYRAEVFAERTGDEKGDRTLVHVRRLEKTHAAWKAWANLEALDTIAAEPVGKQEALLWISKAWLYEQKTREFGQEIGGAENVSHPVIDDTRVNIGPIGKGFDPYAGNVGGVKGLFALQWYGEAGAQGVRGAFVSEDMMRAYRVFGDGSEEGGIEFLFVAAGDDEGIEVKMERRRDGEKFVWEGSAQVLGDIMMERFDLPEGEGNGERESVDSSYEGRSGRVALALSLKWSGARVEGRWIELQSGAVGKLDGVNHGPGILYVDRWQVEEDGGANVPAMWFLKRSKTLPVSWQGKAIYLNGHEEAVSFTKQ